jgi:hypothetical protein
LFIADFATADGKILGGGGGKNSPGGGGGGGGGEKKWKAKFINKFGDSEAYIIVKGTAYNRPL